MSGNIIEMKVVYIHGCHILKNNNFSDGNLIIHLELCEEERVDEQRLSSIVEGIIRSLGSDKDIAKTVDISYVPEEEKENYRTRTMYNASRYLIAELIIQQEAGIMISLCDTLGNKLFKFGVIDLPTRIFYLLQLLRSTNTLSILLEHKKETIQFYNIENRCLVL